MAKPVTETRKIQKWSIPHCNVGWDDQTARSFYFGARSVKWVAQKCSARLQAGIRCVHDVGLKADATRTGRPMSHLISRRHFTLGVLAAGGTMLATARAQQRTSSCASFHNQPSDSPLHKRLSEMWAAVKEETGGRVQVQTFSDNNQIPGGDPAALNMVVSGELDFFTLNGGSIGNLVPASNVQGILFAFRTPAQVLAPWTAILEITCARK